MYTYPSRRQLTLYCRLFHLIYLRRQGALVCVRVRVCVRARVCVCACVVSGVWMCVGVFVCVCVYKYIQTNCIHIQQKAYAGPKPYRGQRDPRRVYMYKKSLFLYVKKNVKKKT
jgi:hypothetical protein